MTNHPNKHIQAAITYALEHGWVWVNAGKSAHCFCKLRCGNPDVLHREHHMSIWSTPRNPEVHAWQIRRKVDGCIRCSG